LFDAGHPDVTWFDALVEVCNRSLAATSRQARADRYRVYVHLDTEGGWVNAGPVLPPARCSPSSPAPGRSPPWRRPRADRSNVGRTQRIVPDRTRRLVQDRDRGCRFPGCTARAYLEVHHVLHWRDGGPTDTPQPGLSVPAPPRRAPPRRVPPHRQRRRTRPAPVHRSPRPPDQRRHPHPPCRPAPCPTRRAPLHPPDR
jgi:hypothetical protein